MNHPGLFCIFICTIFLSIFLISLLIVVCGYKVKSKDAKRHKSGAAGRGIPAAGSRAPIFIMDLAAHLHTVQHTTHHYSIEKDYGSFYWIS